MTKLNIGGGKGHPRLPGWTIVDLRKTADLRHDISAQPLPFPDGSVNVIFTSHTLEHIVPQPVAPIPAADDRGLAARGPRAPHQRLEHEAGFVEQNDGRVQPTRVFLMRGHACFRHRPMAASSRSRARASGFWALHPRACRIFQTWSGSYQTLKVRPIRSVMRRQVHRSSGYPAVTAPCLSSATSDRLCEPFSRGVGPGCGLARRLLTPPRRSRFFHLLTVEGETPTSLATSLVPLPRPSSSPREAAGPPAPPGCPWFSSPEHRTDRPDGFYYAEINSESASESVAVAVNPSFASSGDFRAWRCRIFNDCSTVLSGEASLMLCTADFDCSGFVDTDDFDAFVHAFEAGDDTADVDGSGFVDTDDFDFFVHAFEDGC